MIVPPSNFFALFLPIKPLGTFALNLMLIFLWISWIPLQKGFSFIFSDSLKLTAYRCV